MLVLKSQSIGFRISTTYLSLTYTESDGVNIKVDALELHQQRKIMFKLNWSSLQLLKLSVLPSILMKPTITILLLRRLMVKIWTPVYIK